MSRSGYTEDCDENWPSIMWRGAVKKAVEGRRGQAFLREMLTALDTVAGGRLIENDLQNSDGEVCAIGAVGKARGLDMTALDPDESEGVAAKFGVAGALVRGIAYENDDYRRGETPQERFARMRKWVENKIIEERK